MAAVKSASLVTPPIRNADTSATRAVCQTHRLRRIARTQDGVPTSNRPAGTAERTPETFQVRNRQLRRPRGRVVVPVDSAVVGTTATLHGQGWSEFRAPGAIAPKTTDRRP